MDGSPIRRAFRPLRRLYDWTLSWADRPSGPTALFVLAVAESSVFPIPPDVLGIALCAGAPRKSFRFAALCAAGSVLGGALGYLIGWGLWEAASEFFFRWVPGFTEAAFARVGELYERNAFWVVFTAAFTPIPYKVITVTAGVFQIGFLSFLLASAVGRSLRFFLWAALIRAFGPAIKTRIETHFEWAVTAFTILLLGGVWAAGRLTGR